MCLFSHNYEPYPNRDYMDMKDKCCKDCGKMLYAERDERTKIENIKYENGKKVPIPPLPRTVF